MRNLYAAIAACCLASVASAAQFQNGSFELGSFTDNTGQSTDRLNQGDTSITGWTVIGSGTVAWEKNGNPFGLSASDGIYNLDLTGYTDAAPYAGVQQTFDTIVGHVYSLSFDVGNSARFNNAAGAAVTASAYGQTSLSEMAANGTLLAAPVVGTNQMTANNSIGAPIGTFMTATGSFTATTAFTRLSLLGTVGGAYIGLDNVRVLDTSGSSAAPEPATWAMMIVGFGAVGAAMRRRKVSVRLA